MIDREALLAPPIDPSLPDPPGDPGIAGDRRDLMWVDEVTDPATGRVGYDARGSLSSRLAGAERFPRDAGEAMTAVGLLSRFFLGQEPRALGGEDGIMDRHAELLLTSLPKWDPDGRGCDMYYWYYGSYAMFQMGGRHWKEWNEAMKKAAEGPLKGVLSVTDLIDFSAARTAASSSTSRLDTPGL